MNNNEHSKEPGERLVEAYNRMLERVKDAVGQVGKEVAPTLQHALDTAVDKAAELGELSREEAERIGGYLRRDLHDAAGFLADSGRDLREWFQFDLKVVEQGLADIFSQMVDHTRLELDRLQERANKVGEWHTGEIVGIGTLQCKSCDEVLHFHRTGHIPPCPKCHGTTYRRTSMSDE